MRKYIGLDYDLVKPELQKQGFVVKQIENTHDDKHRFDTTLVVRITEEDGVMFLTTSGFALKTL